MFLLKYFVLAVSFPVGHHGGVFHLPPSRKTLSVFSRLIARSLVKMPFSKGVMSGCWPFMPCFQSFLDAICLSRSYQSILGCHSVIPECLQFRNCLKQFYCLRLDRLVISRVHPSPDVSSPQSPEVSSSNPKRPWDGGTAEGAIAIMIIINIKHIRYDYYLQTTVSFVIFSRFTNRVFQKV